MQRQKSILSFFPKPSGTTKNENGAVESDDVEMRGTDTPPEKVPRRIVGWNEENKGASSLFSSIMHKFVRVDNGGDKEAPPLQTLEESHNSPSSGDFTATKLINSKGLFQGSGIKGIANKENGLDSNGLSNQGKVFHVENDPDVPGPDTPGLRPLVSHFKRIQDITPELEDKNRHSLLDANKRAKLLSDSSGLRLNFGDVSSSGTKFEWLEPSKIRDANRRKPSDPLYDMNTLYVPPEAFNKMSASQKQYWSVKSRYMDVVLFFKVGKFYELYELDAEIGHKELDWKMTLSGVGKCRQVGISESGIDDAVQKLVALGYKVGRVEQLETSDQAKSRGSNSVISRKLVQVVTPATATDCYIGHHAVHLLAIKEGKRELDDGTTVYGFAFVDCAALQFWVGSIEDDASSAGLGALLMQVSPKEVIYESRALSREAQKALRKYTITGGGAVQLTPVLPARDFVDASEVRNLIQSKGYFKGPSSPLIDTIGSVMQNEVAVCALGGLIDHLSRMMLDDVLRTGDILPYKVYSGCLRMDGQTMANLELFSNNDNGGTPGTLISYLDNCVTSSGKRLLRNWICHPLKCVKRINDRLDVVESLMNNSDVMSVISQHLQKLPDLERLLGRIKASLQSSECLAMPLIGKKILKQRVKVFGSLVKGLRNGINLLLLLEKEEIISSFLKVFKLPKLNDIDGLDKFLSQFEAAVNSEFPNYQNHDITEKEAETLSVLMELFVEKTTEWSQVINALSCIDVLRSFAVTACMSSGAMSRPILLPESKNSAFSQDSREPVLDIKGLWHPFATGDNGGLPVPNDLFLGKGSLVYHPRSLLLTGPNMGGKSTLLRATCLAVILAQLGCFVPSEKCLLSLVDVIFTRLGATDRLMTGESTFLVECSETASVLHRASQDSLVILDELGRGTSTFDGYAIAYAVFRHLVEQVNCRMLFATHYHPLTKEFTSHPHVKLQHMACAFKSDSESCSPLDQDLVFLYRLASGACPESYGLKVAAMAGIPRKVVDTASEAARIIRKSVGDSFKSSEQRSEFSTLHEDWLKNLVNVAKLEGNNVDGDDYTDFYDTLFCLWHELKSSYR